MSFTREELLERRRFIGSSEVSTILGLNPWQNAMDLYFDKIGAVEPDVSSNLAARLGNKLERPLAEIFAEENGVTVEYGHTFTHAEHSFMKAQVDGFIPEWDAHLEVKTKGLINPRADFSEWGDGGDEVPFSYLVQCQFALMCSGKNAVHLYALLGCGKLNHYTIERHDHLNAMILERLLEFWQCVQNQTPPEGEPPKLETFQRLIREPGKIVNINERFVLEYEALKEQEKLVRDAVAMKKSEVQMAMFNEAPDAEIGATPLGSFHTKDSKGNNRFSLKTVS